MHTSGPLFSLILRGSQVTSCLIISATMQPLYIIFTFLSSLCFLSAGLSIACNNTEYAWPMKDPTFCCKKCLPGQRMIRRSETSCSIECVPCTGNQYSESYNVAMTCGICKSCSKPNMIFKSPCNSTHDAVCTCTDGYKCKDKDCTLCQPIPATTKHTVPPSTTISALTTETTPTTWRPPTAKDTVWFLVITVLLCGGFALVLVTKVKPFLQWIRSKNGYFLTAKAAPVPHFAEDEEVSKPVQEVCEKCDQSIDV